MPVPYRIDCPYCGESIELLLDESVEYQRCIEDCSVCCRPMALAVAFDAGGAPRVCATREDEA
ncbi:MAG: hypothetical protein BGP10_13035 [Rhodanobacter sp. 68-29]|uniref:CPXCG motif-containing cysteine-rich protein n=1 Tax=Rhodanobacter sp. PCA2 TaxID=2006117 RepID=UPI00086910ED|nr:CPXCG motif-containing cysteine-rich protein [Rhodanobacter sp. PCA2]MBA2077279.1 hypothetical protein [Rhodanobacter sp. PCA2]MBN8924525.1 CPXCG motif-containing cysteine-rich protein [Rhodanobacter sp.]ODU73014.1 MAG: hypothetical protein ABT17_13445 [Rhodanobacter sp. SCN 69-32]OJY58250.1 MAG: hypothetical protein BGP10_13035 [Rhodanobacter sp. 68-29]